jgi:peptide-methionine (S)-S-oxide reductase
MIMNRSNQSAAGTEVAVFGGGCFWCSEAVFAELRGVHLVESGYAGGQTDAPTYEEVSTGATGHAEVVRITFDPAVITFSDLLTVFFSVHDPTTKDRQGVDFGSQYRSIILTTSDEQAREATRFIEESGARHDFSDPIVTAVEPLREFFPAETYHQRYYANNGNAPYCSLVITPKLRKLRERFADKVS